jgi:2-keto-4-pentenoate hydratase/2-oxohepta-3-ene-1,7-dioic acid hydratase in catechol pathway
MSARPGKVIGVGLNYRDHAAEAGQPLPERPLLFAKWTTSLIGPGDSIVLPRESDQVDFEAELGLVVGRRVRDVSAADALDALAGVICVNDISARDVQFADGQWTRAKSFDTFCPVGPRLVSMSEVGDLSDLRIRCILNGEVMQDSRTSEMVFSAAEIVSFASRALTLEPGDLIATGTPSGVGLARKPPVFLQPGDEVVVEIENVGELSNRVVGHAGPGPGLEGAASRRADSLR